MIWIIGCLHLGHANIIKHCSRPFANVNEMDDTLIANHNARVGKNDIVYYPGDFSWRQPELYINRLNGKTKILIRGNHEFRMARKHLDCFDDVKDVCLLKYRGKKIWLSHYAHRTWPSKGHGSIHYFSHSHGALEDHGLSTDIGVDCSERITGYAYSPISIDEIIEYMDNKVYIEETLKEVYEVETK